MHIPENYLSPTTCVALTAVMIPLWKKSGSIMKTEINRKKIPLIGIGAAFSFLVMMFNIPLPGGTTGHSIGAAILAILLGPYTTLVIESIVLLLQALLFGDGGILAFGANCFNIAFIMPFTAYYVFYGIKAMIKGKKGTTIGAFFAGYISLNVAALTTAILFGIQPLLFTDSAGYPLYAPYTLDISIPAMVIPHLLLAGIIEGVITVSVYLYIKRVSPETMMKDTKVISLKPYIGLLIALILLSPLGLMAAGTAWGEWSAEEMINKIGYLPKGMSEGFIFNTPFPDYVIAGLNEVLAYILAALAGVIICIMISRLIRFRFRALRE